MTVTTKRSLIALLLSFVLVISLFTFGVSATETVSASETESVTETSTEATENKSEESTEKSTATETEKDSETGSEKGTEKGTEKTTEKETTKNNSAANATITTLVINAAIIGAILLIAAILIFKFRAKLGDFLRSVKSELKKIVWSSKEQTRKGFIVVVIIAIAAALALWLIDIAFNTGISMIADLLH